MDNVIAFVVAFVFVFVFFQKDAWAYIDPGSGGYLAGSILSALGFFLSIAAAFAVHFFRNILWRGTVSLWRKHRLLFIAGILVILSGLGFWAHKAIKNPDTALFDPALSGSHMIDAARISPGYDLYDGTLMDNAGHVVKQWSQTYLGVIDKNGDYYAAQSEDVGLWGRYTWDDKPVWVKHFMIHHELLLTPQNTVIVFTKELHQYLGRSIGFDVIREFDKNGREIGHFSLWDHLKEFQRFHRKLELDMPANLPLFGNIFQSGLAQGEHDAADDDGDYYHLNALSVVPPNDREDVHPAFRPGNWLISFRHGSMVFILDKDTKQVLWRAIANEVKGSLEGPHSPLMLSNGDILLFDNGRYRGWSRIIEIDPVTLDIVWEYRVKGFFSSSQGYVQKLPNGNILVTETEKGHVFELTPDQKVVWEYYYPDQDEVHCANTHTDNCRRGEIYKMTRYTPEMINPLLKK